MIEDTVDVSRLKVDCKDNSRATWRPPPQPELTSHMGTSYIVQLIANHHPSSDGTGWEYAVKSQEWDEKGNTWETEENMVNATSAKCILVTGSLQEYLRECGV
jgi:hypothetical protein